MLHKTVSKCGSAASKLNTYGVASGPFHASTMQAGPRSAVTSSLRKLWNPENSQRWETGPPRMFLWSKQGRRPWNRISPPQLCVRCGGFFSMKLVPSPAAAGGRWELFHLRRMLRLEEGYTSFTSAPFPDLTWGPVSHTWEPFTCHQPQEWGHRFTPPVARVFYDFLGFFFLLFVHLVATLPVPDPVSAAWSLEALPAAPSPITNICPRPSWFLYLIKTGSWPCDRVALGCLICLFWVKERSASLDLHHLIKNSL